jgi:hypothetical protein
MQGKRYSIIIAATVKINEVIVASGDDWQGVYLNNILQLQGHGRARAADILAWGSEHSPYRVSQVWVNCDWLEENGQLPEKFEDVVVDSSDTPRPELAMQ